MNTLGKKIKLFQEARNDLRRHIVIELLDRNLSMNKVKKEHGFSSHDTYGLSDEFLKVLEQKLGGENE